MSTIKIISKTIPFKRCSVVTEKAFAVVLLDKSTVWIPKSVCYSCNSSKGFIIIQSWFASHKGI